VLKEDQKVRQINWRLDSLRMESDFLVVVSIHCKHFDS